MAEALKLLHLSEQKIAETLKNEALKNIFVELVDVAKPLGELTKQKGALLYQLGAKSIKEPQCKQWLPLVVNLIMTGDIRFEPQLTAAMNHVFSKKLSNVDESELRESCGAGVVVTSEQIEDEVRAVIEANKEALLAQRYAFNTGKLLGEVRNKLKWADGARLKQEMETRIFELLGPKTEEELNPKKKKAAKPVAKPKEANNKDVESELPSDGAATIEELMKTRTKDFHGVGENYKTDGYFVTPDTARILKEHVKRVNGKVVTRFPPEPNGILHLGHAKAIGINFGYAKAQGGYTPARITYSSDNFEQLYKWAVQLIEKDLAYVCHQRVEEMRGFDVKESPYRNRPVSESLQLFEDMKNGKFEEGAATLRLKTVLEEGKVDPVAYRIKYVPHHRTGNTWCIYPTYDYTHCLCDSIEDITHSMCTKEFQSRRSSYYWLCNALGIYCPVQWEYGRLNIEYTVVSKRKILKLITNRIVRDWDDPRLFTLPALRRRGVPPEAVNNFVASLGLTGSQMAINPMALDAAVRDYLNVHAPRTMAVLEPLKIRIKNFKELGLPSKLAVEDFPSVATTSKHEVEVSDVVYIEQSDYRHDNTDKNFRRLTKNQAVALKYVALVLTVVEEVVDQSGAVTEVVVSAEKLTDANKPKAFIHWVCNPVRCEVRMYDRLFHHKNPEDPEVVPGGFLEDCNSNSLTVLKNVCIDKYLANSKVYDRFQFERTGYFAVDQDSQPGKLVFNRTVLLKEDSGK
uniref:glutamine--tRNA ligase n=1 Tax=Steinernema glaseri TaxID=37863 RepID=A0A1I7XX61_9BILA